MQRTQIYLDERQIAELKASARATRRTVSQVIREAIDDKLSRPREVDEFDRALDAAAGLWAKREDIGSTDEYVRRVRRDRRGAALP
ncbi:MAG: CopG family transcriptional regulator [Candidatus Dormibacteria bacterium]